MAEIYLRDLAARAGLSESIFADSAATSAEELGNPLYPPVRHLLAKEGLSWGDRTARQLRTADYGEYDLLIGMDEENLRAMRRRFGDDPEGKLRLLLDYAGRPGEAVADPWYTRDFRAAWDDVREGCRGLLEALTGTKLLDFDGCESREALYAVLRRRLGWQDWYGENLDALWDILTGLPHEGDRFTLALPREDGPVRDYAEKIRAVFGEAENEK